MRKLLAVPLMLLVLLTGGCWDQTEINDLALVVATGTDLGDKPEEKVIFTAQIANPRVLVPEGGGPGGAEPFWTVTGKAPTIRSAAYQMAHRIPRQLFFGHTRLHVIGLEMARQGITPCFDRVLRSRQARSNQFMAIAGGTAKEVLETEMSTFQASGLALINLFARGSQQGIMPMTIGEFTYNLSTETASPVAPMVRVVPQTSVSSGEAKEGSIPTLLVGDLAVFSNDGKMVGIFNEDETQGLLWVLNKVQNSSLNIPCPVTGPESTLTMEIRESNARTKVKIGDDGMPHFEVTVVTAFNVAEHFGYQADIESVAYMKGLEKRVNTCIEQEIKAAVRKAQLLNADVFLFGEEVRRQHRREWHDRFEGNWQNIFPTVEVKIKTKTAIHNRGLAVGNPGALKED